MTIELPYLVSWRGFRIIFPIHHNDCSKSSQDTCLHHDNMSFSHGDPRCRSEPSSFKEAVHVNGREKANTLQRSAAKKQVLSIFPIFVPTFLHDRGFFTIAARGDIKKKVDFPMTTTDDWIPGLAQGRVQISRDAPYGTIFRWCGM